jgi:hypothetical protein
MRWCQRGRFGRASVGVLMIALAAVGTGCQPPESRTPFTDQVMWAIDNGSAPGSLPWFCRSQGGGRGPLHEGIAHDHYAGKAKGDLSWSNCLSTASFFDKAWEAVKRYPRRRDALAAGGVQAVQHVIGTGTHDVVPGISDWQLDAPDPAHPFYLQYDGDGPDAKLAGMSWYVVRFQDGPPPGLPGDNDWWHTHTSICYTNVGVGAADQVSDEECAALGGVNISWPYGWMVHAWIVPGYEHHPDVFAGANGCVNTVTGAYAPPEDPCHQWFGDGHNHPPQLPGPARGTVLPMSADDPLAHGR